MPLPKAVVSDGNLMVLWIPTIAVPSVPTVTELTAGGVRDLSCYLTSFAPGTTEGVVNSKRICTRVTTERRGMKTNTLQMQYVYNIALPAEDIARLTLVEGTLGFIGARWAVPYDDAVAADDVFDIFAVECGEQMKQEGAENDDFVISQKMFLYDLKQSDVTIVA